MLLINRLPLSIVGFNQRLYLHFIFSVHALNQGMLLLQHLLPFLGCIADKHVEDIPY